MQMQVESEGTREFEINVAESWKQVQILAANAMLVKAKAKAEAIWLLADALMQQNRWKGIGIPYRKGRGKHIMLPELIRAQPMTVVHVYI
uniref:Uncharacterized protein n=1 Tax=Gopherus agassizii TaxID=38772 RepID=A0A452I1E0_9SAUR